MNEIEPIRQTVGKLLLVFAGVLLLIAVVGQRWSNHNSHYTGTTNVPLANNGTEKSKSPAEASPKPIDESMAKKLLLASKAEMSHPGIILRFSCQIPQSSAFYPAARKEEVRAEKSYDLHIARELRLEAVKSLEDAFYAEGKKIDVSIHEGSSPEVIMHSVFFDNTTAYQFSANGTSQTLAKRFLHLGVRTISYRGGFDGGSSNDWKAEDVHREEFGEVESLCEEVRSGSKSPDTINATISNPH